MMQWVPDVDKDLDEIERLSLESDLPLEKTRRSDAVDLGLWEEVRPRGGDSEGVRLGLNTSMAVLPLVADLERETSE